MRFVTAACMLTALLAVAACSGYEEDYVLPPKGPTEAEFPAHFPSLLLPEDQAYSPDKFALGRALFFEPGLSRDGSVSCASCHLQAAGFGDPQALSLGIDGAIGRRNSPPLANLAWATTLFWDGRATSLEDQVRFPIENPFEMGSSLDSAVAFLRQNPTYRADFEALYPDGATAANLANALAVYQRALISANSPFDRFWVEKDTSALSESAFRGFLLFTNTAVDCYRCHALPLFTDFSFQNNGLYTDYADAGREQVTQRFIDEGKFKVPSLRNVAVTAPYMHDGSFTTLEAVLAHYNRGGEGHRNQSPDVRPLNLTPQQLADLRAFLEALTDTSFLTNPNLRP